jgi:broad-specificity NMP kinase
MQMILLLCGLPGAGKSTLASKMKPSDTRNISFDMEFLCFDELFLQKHGTKANVFAPDKWKISQEDMFQQAKHLLSTHNVRKKPCILVIDDSFYYQSMRKRYFQLAEGGR